MPFDVGGANVTVACAFPAVAESMMGALGASKTSAKFAVIEVSAASVKVQAGELVQAALPVAPDHPANAEPGNASAVRVTTLPAWMGATHVSPQLIPPGDEETKPEPAPAVATVTE